MACRELCLFVSGLPSDVNVDELAEYLGRVSKPVSLVLLKKGTAIFQCDSPESADSVQKKLDKRSFRGDEINLRFVSEEEWPLVEAVMKTTRHSMQPKDTKEGFQAESTSHPQQPVQLPAAMATLSVNIPRLPVFYGEDNKGECSYEQWRAATRALVQSGSYQTHILMQAIRRSLRGTAADVLLHLGDEVNMEEILSKFDTVFGNVLAPEFILEQLYTSTQNRGETVASWSCRLEDLKLKVQHGPFSASTLKEMVRAKFWSGLRSSEIKNATRSHFESGLSYDDLLVKARIVESEQTKISVASCQQQVKPPKPEKDEQLDKIMKRLTVIEQQLQIMKKPAREKRHHNGEAERKKFDGRCFYCNKQGHKREQCFALKRNKTKDDNHTTGFQGKEDQSLLRGK